MPALSQWDSPPVHRDGWDPSGTGGATPGAPIVRGPFSFAFDTPNLNDGVEFYTPVAGELLLGVYVTPLVDWDGTNQNLDIGSFVGTTEGLIAEETSSPFSFPSATAGIMPDGSRTSSSLATLADFYDAIELTADPLLLVVSQDGTKGGLATGATQGQARLYIVTAVPVAL